MNNKLWREYEVPGRIISENAQNSKSKNIRRKCLRCFHDINFTLKCICAVDEGTKGIVRGATSKWA